MSPQHRPARRGRAVRTAALQMEMARITEAELEAMALLAANLTPDEVAATLSISRRALEDRISRVKIKTGARTARGAIASLYKAGLLIPQGEEQDERDET